MKKILITACLSTAFAAPAFANSDIIEIRPGQWRSQTSLSLGGFPLSNDVKTQCISEADSRRSLNSLIAQAEREAQCKISNVRHNNGQLSLDATCYIEDISATATGAVVGAYNDSAYQAKAAATVDMFGSQVKLTAEASGQYIGPCGR